MKTKVLLMSLAILFTFSTLSYASQLSFVPNGAIVYNETQFETGQGYHIQIVVDDNFWYAYGTMLDDSGTVLSYCLYDIYTDSIDVYMSIDGQTYNYIGTVPL